jgi:hypothetical protein
MHPPGTCLHALGPPGRIACAVAPWLVFGNVTVGAPTCRRSQSVKKPRRIAPTLVAVSSPLRKASNENAAPGAASNGGMDWP